MTVGWLMLRPREILVDLEQRHLFCRCGRAVMSFPMSDSDFRRLPWRNWRDGQRPDRGCSSLIVKLSIEIDDKRCETDTACQGESLDEILEAWGTTHHNPSPWNNSPKLFELGIHDCCWCMLMLYLDLIGDLLAICSVRVCRSRIWFHDISCTVA